MSAGRLDPSVVVSMLPTVARRTAHRTITVQHAITSIKHTNTATTTTRSSQRTAKSYHTTLQPRRLISTRTSVTASTAPRGVLSSSPSFSHRRYMSTPAAAPPLLADEYGAVDLRNVSRYTFPSFMTDNGYTLSRCTVAYQTYGTLNAAGDNALIVCHALTGHAVLHDWWGAMLGENLPFDTERYFIVCMNMLGSCYGTTGPTDIDPNTSKPYSADFPVVSVRDSVRLHYALVHDVLKVNRVCSVIGGSLGGMQALEWAYMYPNYVQSFVALSCNAKHTAWQIAVNHVQRQAIMSDPLWNNGYYEKDKAPNSGLSLARQIAMISYRTENVYDKKFGRTLAESPTVSHLRQLSPAYEVESYLLYQGAKILTRFDAVSYVRMTQVLDSHDIGRDRGGSAAALKQIQQPSLIMGIDSDVLYPMHEQKELAAQLNNTQFIPVHSLEGHDGFLLEQKAIGAAVKVFFDKNAIPPSASSASAAPKATANAATTTGATTNGGGVLRSAL